MKPLCLLLYITTSQLLPFIRVISEYRLWNELFLVV